MKGLRENPDKPFSGRIIIESDGRIIIEECKKILLYTNEMIKLRSSATLEIEGEDLQIMAYSDSNVAVLGRVSKITFFRTENGGNENDS